MGGIGFSVAAIFGSP